MALPLSGEQPAGWARFDHKREISYAFAKFAKAAITMIAMITVPPKKAIFGDRFIC